MLSMGKSTISMAIFNSFLQQITRSGNELLVTHKKGMGHPPEESEDWPEVPTLNDQRSFRAKFQDYPQLMDPMGRKYGLKNGT